MSGTKIVVTRKLAIGEERSVILRILHYDKQQKRHWVWYRGLRMFVWRYGPDSYDREYELRIG